MQLSSIFNFFNAISWSKKLGVVFLSGASLTLAFAPFNFIIIVPVSLLILLYYLEHSLNDTAGKLFILGFVYGFGHFSTSLYWISYALLFEPEKFGWLVPFALILIPGLISIFVGLFVVIIGYILRGGIDKGIFSIVFSSAWVLLEFARSYSILNFPWNLLGYTGADSLYFSQIASVIGVWGMSFVICLASVILYSKKLNYIALVYTIILGCWIYGYIRVNSAQLIESKRELKLRVVQPNFKEFHLGNEEKKIEQLNDLIYLSSVDNGHERDLIIWPEASFPFLVDTDMKILRDMANVMRLKNLVFGGDRIAIESGFTKFYNSIFILSRKSSDIEFYDKIALVPFGEYIPFKKIFPFMNKIASGMGEFSSGKEKKLLEIHDVGMVLPFICFEIAFDSLYHSTFTKNALFILNITNDLWFRNSIGAYQHFTTAKIRAIEYGVPLVRVATSGISAVVDQYGQILSSIDLDTRDIADFDLSMRKIDSIYIDYKLKGVILTVVLMIVIIAIISAFIKSRNIKLLLK